YAPNIYNKSEIDTKLNGKLNTHGDINTPGHITTTNGNIEASIGSVTGKSGSFSEFSSNRNDRKTSSANNCWCI
ncbi:MAG: hypothetical protein ACKPKO_35870, partial [Candidatus Fonsibacter sp.]